MKKRITIPKGFEDCDGGKCEKTQTFEIDIPETKPTVETVPEVEIQGVGQPPQQTIKTQPPTVQIPPTEPPKQEGFTKDQMANLLPPGVNFATCSGPNCGDEVIKSKKITTKYLECPSCGCNMVAKGSNICPCCGKSGPEDEEERVDYWLDSSIEIEADE